MQALLAAVRDSGLADNAVLAGEVVTCTLPLSELQASLSVDELKGAATGLMLEGQLPAGAGRLVLTPEKGIGGALAALSEIEVDEPSVDEAWVIRGDGPALLLSLVPVLVPLAAAAPRIEVSEDLLRVRFTQAVSALALGAPVRQALALWERAASFRLGAG